MYQFVVESLLGVQRSGNRLCLRPLLPRQWTTFDIQCHFGASRHDISCRAEAGLAASVVHNGIEADSGSIRLVDDGQVHVIVVNLGDRSFINPSAHKPDGARGESLQDSQHDHSIAESS
jgi:cellobiose phosphorylase